MREVVRDRIVVAVVLLAIWYVLSGMFDVLHFGTGVATAVVVALAYDGVQDGRRMRVLRFGRYLPWLLLQILISNVRVARMVLSRRMPIRPVFISQAPGVHGTRALTILGVSITLTPGTLTVDIGPEEVFVHALDESSARDIRDELMSQRVATLFERRRA
jgi:multicomponent Na+:H+ antiporter subunit E